MKNKIVAISGAILSISLLSACSSFHVSDEAKDQGKKALCVTSETTIRDLDGGDEAAKAGAILIRDNTKDKDIKKVANKVAKGDGTKKERNELISYIKKQCD